ncbi:hypothetical protein C8R44DRAFT_746062 [Mycena epipterygia]|nr:hypothetical protein C8R44DRAFT_746062 [Mycena epipterygia]
MSRQKCNEERSWKSKDKKVGGKARRDALLMVRAWESGALTTNTNGHFSVPDHHELAVAADADDDLSTYHDTLDDGRHTLGSERHIRAELDDNDGADRDRERLQGQGTPVVAATASRGYPVRIPASLPGFLAQIAPVLAGLRDLLVSFFFSRGIASGGDLAGVISRAYCDEIGLVIARILGSLSARAYITFAYHHFPDPILFIFLGSGARLAAGLRAAYSVVVAEIFWRAFPCGAATPRSRPTFHLYAAAAAAPLPATWDPPLAPDSPHHTNFNSIRVNASANTTPHNSILDPVPRPNNHGTNKPEYRMDARRGIAFAHAAGPVPWDERLIFIAARDTREMELLMSVCPQWGRAVETHNFWNAAITLIDPNGQYAHFAWLAPPSAPSAHSSTAAPAPIRVSPYRHFRTLLSYACLPCRLNAPRSGHGLHTGRKTIGTLRLGAVVLCKDHYERRRTRFCGVCLRDGVLGRMVKQDLVRVAQEALAHAEHALWEVGQIYHGGHPAMDAAWEARAAAGEAVAKAQRAEETAGLGEIADNEDDATFPGVHATCRACRAEWLWRCAVLASAPAPTSNTSNSALAFSNTTAAAPEDAETPLLRSLGCAAPGVFAPMDPLVRAAVSAFVDLGEGTVHNVLLVAGERQWLRAHTRWAELMGQAVAARRFNAGGGYNTTNANPGADRGRQDYSGYATTVLVKSGDRGRRRARSVSLESVEEYDEHQKQQKRPAVATDAYANNAANNAAYAHTPEDPVKAMHPVPWAVSPPSSPAASVLPPTDEAQHPGPPGPPPPSYALTEAAHTAHARQMRAVLLPAFRNVVRRIIVECALDAVEADDVRLAAPGTGTPRKPLDPAVRAARMPLADVVRELREEEGVWFDGVDWSERRRNARAEAEVGAGEGHRTEGSDDSSEGTSSRTSDTSPVLSTSTLGTTPSPPPLEEHRKDEPAEEERLKRQQQRETEEKQHRAKEREARERQPTIAVMPVLDPPRLLRPIPYVPKTIAHLPPYSLEALKAVWREACAPLYHCRCSICERANAAAQAAQGGNPTVAIPPATTARAQSVKPEHPSEPLVLQLPAEDDTGGRGADSVVSLVHESYPPKEEHGKIVARLVGLVHAEDDKYYAESEKDGDDLSESLSPRERYWRQVEEEEGEGVWEREMELIDDMQQQQRRPVDEYSEGDEFEEEEGAGAGAKYALGPTPAAWVAGARKRSVDELEPDADVGGEVHASARGGTPPKRARTGERELPTVRLLKRRSEELDASAGDADVDTASAGSASKRARVEGAESPPDTSTPGTGSGEESPCDVDPRSTYPTVRLESAK